MTKRRAKRFDTPITDTTDSQRVKRPVMDRSRMGVNPFEGVLSIPSSNVVMSGQYRVDGSDLLQNELTMDRQMKTSVFISSNLRKSAMCLTPSAMKLFVWILYELEYGCDYLWINKDRFLDESSVSLNSYKGSVEILCRYGYIHPVVNTKDVYWINPSIAFNGSRVKSFPKNIR